MRDAPCCTLHLAGPVHASKLLRRALGAEGECLPAQMDRAASHPMSFTQVAAAIQEVSNALQAGESPAVAETKAVQAAEAIGAEANNPDEEVSSIWPAKA